MANTPTYEFFTPSPVLAGVEAAVNAVNISRAEYEEAERAKQQYARFADVLESQGFEGDALAHRALAESIRPNFSKAIREKKTSDFGLSKLNDNILNIFQQERRNQALVERQANQIDAVNRRAEFSAANQRANTLANSSLTAARQYESRGASARQNAARARGQGDEALARQFDAEASQFEAEAKRLRDDAMRSVSAAPRSISGLDAVDDQLPQEDPYNSGVDSSLFGGPSGSDVLLNPGQAPFSPFDATANPVLENARKSALATRFAENPTFVELINKAGSVKAVDDIIRRFERDQSGSLALRRDERAEDAQNLRSDNQSAKARKFSTIQEAQEEAAKVSQYLSPNQDVKIGGADGAYTISVVSRKEGEVVDLDGGGQLLIIGDRVMKRSPESPDWQETNMTPAAARNALRVTGQDRIPAPTAIQAEVSPQAATNPQQPLTPQQRATNVKDAWLKQLNKQ